MACVHDDATRFMRAPQNRFAICHLINVMHRQLQGALELHILIYATLDVLSLLMANPDNQARVCAMQRE